MLLQREIIDIASDEHKTLLLKYYKNNLLPNSLLEKAASAIQIEKKAFSKAAYADKGLNKFPCIDKETTLANWAYFLDQLLFFPELTKKSIINNFKKFAGLYNATKELTETTVNFIKSAKVSDSDKKLLETEFNLGEIDIYPDHLFGYIHKSGDQKYKLFPLRNKGEILKTAEYLIQRRKNIPPPIRNVLARNILKRANEEGISYYFRKDLKKWLEKIALYGYINPSNLVKLSLKLPLEKRAANKYKQLLKSLPPNKRVKASLCVRIIRLANDVLPHCEEIPESMVELPEEIKSNEPDLIKLLNGALLDRQKLLMDFPKNILKKFFGDELDDFITNSSGGIDEEAIKSWAESLPIPDANTLVIIIKKHKPEALVKKPTRGPEDEVPSVDELTEETEEEMEEIEKEKEDEKKEDKKQKKDNSKNKNKSKKDEEKDEDRDED